MIISLNLMYLYLYYNATAIARCLSYVATQVVKAFKFSFVIHTVRETEVKESSSYGFTRSKIINHCIYILGLKRKKINTRKKKKERQH